MKASEKHFIRGALYVIALHRRYSLDADQLLKESGITREDADKAGVDSYDMEQLLPLWTDDSRGLWLQGDAPVRGN